MERAQFAKQRRIDAGRRRLGAVHPGEHLLVGDLQPAFDFGEVGIGQSGQFGVGKAAQHQVHLANTAMPEPELEPFAPFVQSVA